MIDHQAVKRCARFCLVLLPALFLMSTARCHDPEEYDPNEPLEPPPAPPVLIYPLPDTNLWGGTHQLVLFDWTTIPGAGMYDIMVDTSATFTTPATSALHLEVQVARPPAYIELIRYTSPATYYTMIRAASTSWTGYTEWSEPRRFFLRIEASTE